MKIAMSLLEAGADIEAIGKVKTGEEEGCVANIVL